VQYILGALSKQGLAPSQHLPCSSMELVKSLVIDGVGIGILPYRVATHGVASGRLVAVSRELPSFDDSIALVRRFDMHQTAAARLLLDALREHGRSMPELPR
jgi:DNA-binding transcriptional LysR family regulator